MGRASSSKKVARAASTGGGRTARGARPLGWYAAIALVVVLGVAGIVTSRAEHRASASTNTAPPVANKDHWHAAYGVYLCDQFAPASTDTRDPQGIHTHGDGIIHLPPFVRSAAGANATLKVFADTVRMDLSDDRLQLPGGKAYKSGDTKCDGKTGIVQVKVNNKVITKEVASINPKDGDLITIAFAPKGANIPPPPSADALARLNPQTEQIEPTTAPGETTTTAAGGETTGDSTTTTAAP
jgi:hypothetical protein